MPKVYARLLVAFVLVGACAVGFGRLVGHPRDILVGPQRDGANDLTEYFQPLRVFQIESWKRHGQLPTWDPHLQLGRTIAGNPQTGLYYPANWLYSLFGTERITSWILVAHHLFGGWGMYLLCRRFNFERLAALLGGVTLMLAPYLVAQTAEGHYPQVSVAAWMPWAFLCFERLRTGRRFALPLMALVFALAFFAGHAQEVYYLVIVLSVLVVVDVIAGYSKSPDAANDKGESQDASAPSVCKFGCKRISPAQLLLAWIGVGLLSVGLVAIDFLPIWRMSLETSRVVGGISAEGAGGAQWSNLRQMVYPFALGSPESALRNQSFYWETLLYVGVAPLALAVFGVVAGWKTYPVPRYTILFVFLLLFALGASTPVYVLLHKFLPGMSTFRIPSRIMFLAAAVLSVLAAAGAQQLLFRRRSAESTGIPRRSWTEACVWVAMIAVVAELSIHAWAITRVLPYSHIRQESGITQRFKGSATQYRVLVDQHLLGDEEAFRHDIAKVRGYEPFLLLRYTAMLEALIGPRDLLNEEAPGYVTHPQLAYAQNPRNLLGVRYAVLPSAEAEHVPGWNLVGSGSVAPRISLTQKKTLPQSIPYAIYENDKALPRAFVLGHIKAAEGRPAELLQSLEPTRELIVTRDELPRGPRADFTPAKILEYSPGRVVVDAELAAPGYLVLTDTLAAGWKAQANGKPAALIAADFGLRGVPLPAGKQRVMFSYSPPLWRQGALLSAIALVVCVYLLIRGRSQPKD
jgi:hypothetical protein